MTRVAKDTSQSKSSGRGFCLVSHVDIYDVDVVLYCGDEKHCYDTLKKYCDKHIEYDVSHLYRDVLSYIDSIDNTSTNWCMYSFEKGKSDICLIVVEELDLQYSEDLGTLVHETLHAANYILSKRGVVDDKNGFESLTYLHEYIFKDFYNKIGEKQKKEEKK